MTLPHQPHDKYFKASLKEKQIAVDFLKAHLPPEIYERLEMSTLRLTDKSLELPELKEMHCDIVYTCRIDSKDGYIPILFQMEHLSTAPKHTALYLLQGSVSLMAQHLKAGHDKLPLVLPICVYHGKKSPYPYSRDIFDHFDNPELARVLMFKPFSLVDLTTMPEATIKEHGTAALMELLLKWYGARNLIKALAQSTDGAVWRLTLTQTTEPYFKAVLEYISSAGNKRQSVDELLQVLSETLPEKREMIMTFAQQLIEKGMQAKHPDVWQRAEQKGKLEAVKLLLARGFNEKALKDAMGLTDLDLHQLKDDLTEF